MPFRIVRDDIARMSADAIVMPANEDLLIDGGTGYAIAERAGLEQVRAACARIGGCEPGDAIATPAFGLPARVIIHAVGPVWIASVPEEQKRRVLRNAYDRAIDVAVDLGCTSLAMPLLSANTNGAPADVSLRIALDAIREALDAHELTITLVLHSTASMRAAIASFTAVESYIDEEYLGRHRRAEDDPSTFFGTGSFERLAEESFSASYAGSDALRKSSADVNREAMDAMAPARAPRSVPAPAMRESAPAMGAARPAPLPSSSPKKRKSLRERLRKPKREEEDFAPAPAASYAPTPAASSMPAPAPSYAPTERRVSLNDKLAHAEPGFSDTLLSLIDARGLTDAQVYKRANLSRQLFSKIRTNPDYRPKKTTALALCIALELNRAQTNELLSRAGYALSRSSKADLIVEWYIDQGIFDSFTINETLFAFDQPLLGA